MNFNHIQISDPNDVATASNSDYNFSVSQEYGWICPKCGRVYSPLTPTCLYCGNNNVMPPTTNTYPTKEWWRDYCTITCDPSKPPLKQELPITTDDTDVFCVHYDQLPYYATITTWNKRNKI